MPPSYLQTLPTELFSVIAECIPLYAAPSTLLSLSLTSHAFYGIVHPLLYSELILRNEDDALEMINKIVANPGLGRLVRGLHIMSNLSGDSINMPTSQLAFTN